MSDPTESWEAWWLLQGGLFRRPYINPLQHDFRVLSRLAPVFQAPAPMHSADRTEGFIRHWGVVPIDELGEQNVPVIDEQQGIVYSRADPERVRWCDSTRCHRSIDLANGEVWEVARCVVPRWAAGTLERVATFLSAQPLDEQGAPDGAPFVTNIDTPLCIQPTHPTLGESLDFEWLLRVHGGPTPAPLVAAPFQSVPVSDPPDGLPFQWSDWRYQWQGRYSVDHKSILSSTIVRLFARVAVATPTRWQVNVGGILTVWYQAVNPYDNEVARQGVITR